MADEQKLEHGEVLSGGEFFLAVCAGSDDVIKVDWDGNVGFVTQEEALDWTKENAFDGSEYMLYRCTPIKRVTRGPVRVLSYTPPKPKKVAKKK